MARRGKIMASRRKLLGGLAVPGLLLSVLLTSLVVLAEPQRPQGERQKAKSPPAGKRAEEEEERCISG